MTDGNGRNVVKSSEAGGEKEDSEQMKEGSVGQYPKM